MNQRSMFSGNSKPSESLKPSHNSSNRDKGGGDSQNLSDISISQKTSEKLTRRDQEMIEEPENAVVGNENAIAETENPKEQTPKEESVRNSKRSQPAGGRIRSEVDTLRLHYYTANPIPDHSIGIFYERSEAVSGPGKPSPLFASCYMKPAKPAKPVKATQPNRKAKLRYNFYSYF